MYKKFIVIALAVVLMFSVIGCGNTTKTTEEAAPAAEEAAPAAEEAAPAAEEAAPAEEAATTEAAAGAIPDKDGDGVYVVGINTWVQGNFALDTITSCAVYSYESLGFDTITCNDEANVDKTISNVQNMISQGADIIDYWAVNDSCALAVAQLCSDNSVPFVLRDSFPTDEAVVEQIKANPMFLGYFGLDYYQSGCDMAQYAIDAGYTKGLITGVDLGQSGQDARCNGFNDTASAAGIEILGVARPNSTSMDEIQQQIDDLLVANQDAEFWYSAFLDCTTAGATTLDSLGMNCALYVSDINPTSIEAIKADEYVVINGCQWITATWTAALVYNYFGGHQILDADGNAPIVTALRQLIVTKETADIFSKHCLEEQPFSVDYIKDLCYDVNAEHATLEYYESELTNMDLAYLLKIKEAEGTVTADELAAAGIA